jgi:hypothetical protein
MHPQESPSDAQSVVALRRSVDEIAAELARVGWGQPTRLFSLVSSDLLLADEPDMAAEIGAEPGTLTAIEQEEFDREVPVETMLAGITWPAAVHGAAIALEQLVLPPSAEADLPADANRDAVAAAAAADDRATTVRIVAAVTRNGGADTVLVVDGYDGVIRGRPDERLAPSLTAALAGTFREV